MLKKILKSYDYTLVIVAVLLAVFGLIMIYSASAVTAMQIYGYESDHFFARQRLFLIAGAFVFLFFAIVPYKLWLSNKLLVPLVLGTIAALVALLFFGSVAGNAQSWFEIGRFKIQPAEFVNIGMIIYLSAVYAKKQPYINEFNKGVVPPVIYLVIICFLIILQPDFGTAGIIFLTGACIILASGMNFKNMMKLAGIGTLFAAIAFLLLRDKIMTKGALTRIQTFLDPFSVEDAGGYQIVNSYIAIASGGLKGLGLGESIQKLGYLPEPHTDFIMAIVAEELGLLGVLFVIFSLGYIVLRGILIGLKCKDAFGSLLAFGIASMIGIQSFVNLGGITGIIPLTGVPLPFVSYGGSSILQLSISMGILLNVSMFVNYEQKYKNKAGKTGAKKQGNVPSISKGTAKLHH